MQILEIQNDIDLRHNSLPRSPGMHVSEIIRDVCLTMGYLKKEDEEELDWSLAKYRLSHGEDIVKMFPTAFYRVAFGLSWEEWLGGQLDINFHGIGELWRGGIVGTVDGLTFNPDGSGTLHEIKATWKSSKSNRMPPQTRMAHEFMYICQLKSYIALVQAHGIPCLEAVMHVFWVNGNYKGSGPEYRRYLFTFTQQEIDANWRLLANAARRLQQQ